MGLDMYLNAKRHLADYSGNFAKDEQPIAKAVIKASGLEDIAEPQNTISVTVCAIYWRKANAIHQWFVDNVQGGRDECQESYVSEDDLKKLLQVCNEVIADWSKAPGLLPTQAGFFFGNTEYDEWYQQDVKETAEKLERLLNADHPKYIEFYYQSSW